MDDRTKLIAEYERLRKLMHELDVQAASVDERLVEIERELPNDYPDDRSQHIMGGTSDAIE